MKSTEVAEERTRVAGVLWAKISSLSFGLFLALDIAQLHIQRHKSEALVEKKSLQFGNPLANVD